MQSNAFDKVNVSTRMLILLMIVLGILIAKSIYLIILLTLLFVFVFLLTNKSVKFYIDLIKNVKLWLLFVFIAYIIIFRNVVHSFIFTYKILLVLLYVIQFNLTTTFSDKTNAIKTLIKPMNKVFDTDQISYNIVVFIYFFFTYINSKQEIFKKYNKEEKIIYSFSLKHNILPRFLFTVSKISELESSLKLKFYRPRFEKKLKSSNTILVFVLLFFLMIVFKEVII